MENLTESHSNFVHSREFDIAYRLNGRILEIQSNRKIVPGEQTFSLNDYMIEKLLDKKVDLIMKLLICTPSHDGFMFFHTIFEIREIPE